MAKARTSGGKRQREQAKREKKQRKAERRARAKDPDTATETEEGVAEANVGEIPSAEENSIQAGVNLGE